MRYGDLRQFIALLEDEGELRRVSRAVSTEFEIAAGIRKMSNNKGPALFFENVVGHDMALVPAPEPRQADALGRLYVAAQSGNQVYEFALAAPGSGCSGGKRVHSMDAYAYGAALLLLLLFPPLVFFFVVFALECVACCCVIAFACV